MYSISEAARILQLDHRTVSDLIRLNGIATHRHPTNIRGKAIDEAGLETLRKAKRRAVVPA